MCCMKKVCLRSSWIFALNNSALTLSTTTNNHLSTRRHGPRTRFIRKLQGFFSLCLNLMPEGVLLPERDCRAPHSLLSSTVGGLAACKSADTKRVQLLHRSGDWERSSGGALYAVCKHGSNSLMWAASAGSLELVSWLLESTNKVGAYVNHQNKDGRTALMFAAKYGHLAVLQALLDANADVELVSRDGTGVFDWAVYGSAASNGKDCCMRFLAQTKPDLVSRVNKFGCSAVHWAAAAGKVSALRWLFETFGRQKDLDFELRNLSGHGALVKAAWKNRREAVEWLLLGENGPQLTEQLEWKDKAGLTADELADLGGHRELGDRLRILRQEFRET